MKKANILMGLPLSGKSTWVEKKGLHETFKVVSADTLKEGHPDYDPNNAHLIHEWSVIEAEKLMNIFAEGGVNVVMDGGGINNSYTKRIIKKLKKHNYHVTLTHINTPLEVCLERNLWRKRKVPQDDIIYKAAKERAQFLKLQELVDEVEIVEHFTNKHFFVDMDGVIAALTTLPRIDGKIDFVNSEIFTNLKPVGPVIEKLKEMQQKGYILYILSATPNSISYDEKNAWLDLHLNIPKERRYFVNSGIHKSLMLDNLRLKLKLDKRDVTLLDDTHKTLYAVKDLAMKPMHPSEFLVTEFKDLN